MSQVGWAICLRHPEPFVKFHLSTPATAQQFWGPPKGPISSTERGEGEGVRQGSESRGLLTVWERGVLPAAGPAPRPTPPGLSAAYTFIGNRQVQEA